MIPLFAMGCSEYDLSSAPKTKVAEETDEPDDSDIPEPDDTDPPTDIGEVEEVIDEFEVDDENVASDIMFFGDTSGSMSTELETLGADVTRFINRLAQATSSWQIMAVTKGDGCHNNTIIRAVTPNYADVFADAITKKALSPKNEKGLLVAQEAMRNADDPGECNYSFLRPDAQLHIIFISDEPDQSPGHATNPSTYWTDYASEIVQIKGSAALTKFSAVAGPVPGGCPDADEGTGYHEIVNNTGGEFLSICDDWPTQLEVLADASIGRQYFKLSETPIESTIVVFVNGVDRAGDWVYEDSKNRVKFTKNLPGGGDNVEIEYDAQL